MRDDGTLSAPMACTSRASSASSLVCQLRTAGCIGGSGARAAEARACSFLAAATLASSACASA
eukprot:CAMPEP_0204345472 /NCGR_PEP_ID=MMETSP0469-20131031/26427_1 /ASSEMBLY_ACC=CAM_ASM_000384 /TAXON_ID=2969 /ORGANISM="Oxyrrhis marina" /LENGTH=62 /DNA_ID=CAMNT_0051330915 /DNA_START=49 /DNA_END=234 /DNA_ORIENTATION=-